ncbi:hypothetical protein HOE67_02080 [Candidatus Peregrinibacteria bacterium]|jgi:hypothetical protein|nr:hypothetical protein [Candidatus Peregrinibacteria bacterium]MBT4055877.1 hypothetical protein [Candidatus Peregrinibacteria bacterium]
MNSRDFIDGEADCTVEDVFGSGNRPLVPVGMSNFRQYPRHIKGRILSLVGLLERREVGLEFLEPFGDVDEETFDRDEGVQVLCKDVDTLEVSLEAHPNSNTKILPLLKWVRIQVTGALYYKLKIRDILFSGSENRFEEAFACLNEMLNGDVFGGCVFPSVGHYSMVMEAAEDVDQCARVYGHAVSVPIDADASVAMLEPLEGKHSGDKKSIPHSFSLMREWNDKLCFFGGPPEDSLRGYLDALMLFIESDQEYVDFDDVFGSCRKAKDFEFAFSGFAAIEGGEKLSKRIFCDWGSVLVNLDELVRFVEAMMMNGRTPGYHLRKAVWEVVALAPGAEYDVPKFWDWLGEKFSDELGEDFRERKNSGWAKFYFELGRKLGVK